MKYLLAAHVLVVWSSIAIANAGDIEVRLSLSKTKYAPGLPVYFRCEFVNDGKDAAEFLEFKQEYIHQYYLMIDGEPSSARVPWRRLRDDDRVPRSLKPGERFSSHGMCWPIPGYENDNALFEPGIKQVCIELRSAEVNPGILESNSVKIEITVPNEEEAAALKVLKEYSYGHSVNYLFGVQGENQEKLITQLRDYLGKHPKSPFADDFRYVLAMLLCGKSSLMGEDGGPLDPSAPEYMLEALELFRARNHREPLRDYNFIFELDHPYPDLALSRWSDQDVSALIDDLETNPPQVQFCQFYKKDRVKNFVRRLELRLDR